MARTWTKDESAHRDLKVDRAGNYQQGDDVKALQAACNQRARTRLLPQVDVDGVYGPETHSTCREVAYRLGALDGTLAEKTPHGEPVLTVGAQRMIRNPSGRSVSQLARAAKRKVKPEPLRLRAFAVAQTQLGVREQGGNNRGAAVERIIRANGGQVGESWCGDFVAYCYLKAGAKSVVRAWAAVRFLEQLLTRVSSPKRGHVVIYQWDSGDPDHTGLFDEWINRATGDFWAIEGNTGPDGAVSDGNGNDGVRRRRRNTRLVQSWRRVLR